MSDSDAPPSQREPRAMSFAGAAGWTAGIVLLWDAAIELTEAVRPGANGDLVNVTLCHALVHTAALFLLLRLYRPDDRLRDALGVRAVNPALVPFFAMLGAGLYPALARVDERLAAAFPSSTEDIELAERLVSAPTTATRVSVLVSLVLVIFLVEELFFRGMVFGALLKGRGPWPQRGALVVVATAAYFALARMDPRALPSGFVLGLCLAWLRLGSGSIVPAIVAHAAYLAVPLWPLLRSGPVADDASYTLYVVLVGVGGVLLSAVALRFWLPRDTRAREACQADALSTTLA